MEIFHKGEPIDARECTLYLYVLLLAHLLTTIKRFRVWEQVMTKRFFFAVFRISDKDEAKRINYYGYGPNEFWQNRLIYFSVLNKSFQEGFGLKVLLLFMRFKIMLSYTNFYAVYADMQTLVCR